MFEESLVESNPLLRTRNRWPALASIGSQAVLVVVLLTIPLLHPEALVLNANRLTTLAPPPLRPAPPPPPPHPLHVVSSTTSTPTLAPPTLPVQLQRPSSITDSPAVENALLPVGLTGIPTGLPFTIAESDRVGSPHVVVAAGPSGGDIHGPLRLSTGVTAGLLLAPIVPVYPPIARINRTEGVVIVQAIISKSGHIESARAVSGPAMLQAAAVAAVQQAQYRPYLLNGQPTEVETTVTINFKLGS